MKKKLTVAFGSTLVTLANVDLLHQGAFLQNLMRSKFKDNFYIPKSILERFFVIDNLYSLADKI